MRKKRDEEARRPVRANTAFLAMISRMPTDAPHSAETPFCGADLERWRVVRHLSKAEAADAFGLQKAKWDELTSVERGSEPLADPVLGMLLQIYSQHPKSSPVRVPPDVAEFYQWLGLQDEPQSYETFATLIGRAPPSVYRHLRHKGTPGRPVQRWIEAIRRMDLSPRQSLRLMAEIVGSVGQRQGVKQVLTEGWSSKQGDIVEQGD